MHRASSMRTTGQMWKLHTGTVAYVIAALLGVWSLLDRVNLTLLLSAGAISLAGFAFCAFAIRCPKCGAAWYWSAWKGLQLGFARRLVAQTQCQSCGLTATGGPTGAAASTVHTQHH